MTASQRNQGRFYLASLFKRRAFWITFAIVGTTGVIAAHAHLVYVAIHSQPECIAHSSDTGETNGKYRAAKSGCTWREEKLND